MKQNRGLRAHQAMDDCVMLLEVIQHWGDLNFLLANEIASQHGTQSATLSETLSKSFPIHNS